MNRTYSLFVLLAILTCSCSKSDPRLHGTWVSDAELAMRWNRNLDSLPEPESQHLSQRLGHLSIEYGPWGRNVIAMSPYEWSDGTNRHSVAGYTNVAKYWVIEILGDGTYVSVKSERFNYMTYIHFEGPDVFWVDEMTEDPSPREYFRKKR